ncbi:MAG: hypothetical protein GF393_12950, partial [Armatimonadia bacterium]|nr:hypothetical protein [Armatimonadia bacterium]
MNLKFHTEREITKNGIPHLVQKARLDGKENKKFWIYWNVAKKEDEQALKLNCDLPQNIRRILSITNVKCRDNIVRPFAVRVIRKDTELQNAKHYFPLTKDYIPRDKSQLLPYQHRAFEHLCNVLINRGATLDASDTGLGKTYVTAAIAREFGYRPIVICKKIAIASWLQVLRSFGVFPLAVVNWQYAIRGKMPFYDGQKWHVPENVLIVFDEGHFANHEGSKNNIMYEASKGIPSITTTATIGDSPKRLAPLLYVLNAMSKEEFKQWLKQRGELVDAYERTEQISANDDMKALNALLFPAFGHRLRYTDDDVKKMFPEVIYNTFLVSIGEEKKRKQNAHYEKLVAALEELNEQKGSALQAQKIALELRYRQMSEYLKVTALVDLAKSHIEENKSVIIFVNYRETLFELARKLKTKSVIYGNQEAEGERDRNQVIDDFQADKTRIIIAMLDAGGTSISLHDVNGKHQRVAIFCPTYHAINLKQAMGRIYRALTKSAPIMELVYAAGTIEEKVARSVNSKLENI